MIKLPIVKHSEENSILEELEIDVPVDFTNIDYGYFININGVLPCNMDGRDCSIILCNGEQYLCTLLPEEIEKLFKPVFN